MVLQQLIQVDAQACALELRAKAPLAPEFRPFIAPAVLLRGGADVVVAMPAETGCGARVRLRQHATERGKVAALAELEVLEQEIRFAARSSVRDRLRRAQSSCHERLEAVGFRRESIRVIVRVRLDEGARAAGRHDIAPMDAATGDGRCRCNAEYPEKLGAQPDVSLVFARFRRSTRMRSEEYTSELQSRLHLVCRLLLEKKKQKNKVNK